MNMKVKEVSELVGVSIRTLHYYNQIGLLIPTEITNSGYRFYSEGDLETLQQILFFKELDFSLTEIKKMMNSVSYNRQKALRLQKKMLLEKRDRIDKIIKTIDKTDQYMRGEILITKEERFEGINLRHNDYEQEARKHWGDEPIDTVKAKLENMTKDENIGLSNKWDSIFKKLARLCDQSPGSQEVQVTIKEWYNFLNKNVGTYSLDAFYGLGQLYIEDERFTKNIDQYSKGLAKFMSEAIKVFTDRQKKEVSNERHNRKYH